jgi:hypothetical protein
MLPKVLHRGPSEPPKLTSKQKAILQALVTGMTQADAARIVGVSREYVCRLCKEDHFVQEIGRRVDRLKALLAPRALANVAALADGAKSERVRLEANLGLLDRAGHGRDSADRLAFRDRDLIVNIVLDSN